MDESNLYLVKMYIVREVSFLGQDSKKVIRDIILQSHNTLIKEYPDGLRCNLDLLSPECVIQIYNYMKNIVNVK